MTHFQWLCKSIRYKNHTKFQVCKFLIKKIFDFKIYLNLSHTLC